MSHQHPTLFKTHWFSVIQISFTVFWEKTYKVQAVKVRGKVQEINTLYKDRKDNRKLDTEREKK